VGRGTGLAHSSLPMPQAATDREHEPIDAERADSEPPASSIRAIQAIPERLHTPRLFGMPGRIVPPLAGAPQPPSRRSARPTDTPRGFGRQDTLRSWPPPSHAVPPPPASETRRRVDTPPAEPCATESLSATVTAGSIEPAPGSLDGSVIELDDEVSPALAVRASPRRRRILGYVVLTLVAALAIAELVLVLGG
jgi:hypothetical protein